MRIPTPSRRIGALAALLAVAMGVLLVAAGNSNAFGAAAGTSFSPCLPGTHAPSVRYTDGSAIGRDAGLDSIVVDGLTSSSCAGDSAVLTVSGNAAGDPSQPPTETLGRYDSRLNPCTRQKLAHPNVIRHGTITFTGCATGGPDAYANLHDATYLMLVVDGNTLPTSVLGETFTKPGSAATVKSAVTTGAELPFTGSYAALTIWTGLLFLAVGIALSVLGRRRGEAEPN